MASKAHTLDWLNIGLMLLAAAAAFWLPFEVFLISYAVLGPLHYLTEISWLQKRDFFTPRRFDYLWLLALCPLTFLISFPDLFGLQPSDIAALGSITDLAFIASMGMIIFQRWWHRWWFFLCAGLLTLVLRNQPAYVIVFSVFVPTLIHVYVFTAAFILAGALRNRSLPGLWSLAVLLGCGALLLFWQPATGYVVNPTARESYQVFEPLNQVFSLLLGQQLPRDDVYQSPLGIAIMRFIAFAYTYHYLNWFSKTSVIRWHEVSWRRLALIATLWLMSVGLYFYNYKIGFIVLATLSYMHVYLEFPLNHKTFYDIGSRLLGRPLEPAAPSRRR